MSGTLIGGLPGVNDPRRLRPNRLVRVRPLLLISWIDVNHDGYSCQLELDSNRDRCKRLPLVVGSNKCHATEVEFSYAWDWLSLLTSERIRLEILAALPLFTSMT